MTIASAEKHCQFLRESQVSPKLFAKSKSCTISPQRSTCSTRQTKMPSGKPWPPGEQHSAASSAREGVHGPANAHAHQEKKQQGPEDVLHALLGLAAAEKSECNGNHQSKNHQGLQVAEFHSDQRN